MYAGIGAGGGTSGHGGHGMRIYSLIGGCTTGAGAGIYRICGGRTTGGGHGGQGGQRGRMYC